MGLNGSENNLIKTCFDSKMEMHFWTKHCSIVDHDFKFRKTLWMHTFAQQSLIWSLIFKYFVISKKLQDLKKKLFVLMQEKDM